MKTVTITPDKENRERASAFFVAYEVESALLPSQFNSELMLGDDADRKCRFCGKAKPETTFKKKAHLIPQFLGNKFFLSAFECDKCNHTFGTLYEDSLAAYIGAYRPFSGVKGSKANRFPKHKEQKKLNGIDVTRLMIEPTDSLVKIYHDAPFDDSVEIDKKGKRLTVHAKRNPYIPIYAYKALLKIALSMIQEDEIGNFRDCIRFLMDNSQNELLKGYPLCYIHVHQVHGWKMFLQPTAYLYRRKNDSTNQMVPAKTFVLYSGNHIYQIFLPFNQEDQHLIEQPARLNAYPLLFDKSVYESGITYNSYWELLDGHEKVYGENQRLVFSFEEIICSVEGANTKNGLDKSK